MLVHTQSSVVQCDMFVGSQVFMGGGLNGNGKTTKS